jgi:hypothetical protein
MARSYSVHLGEYVRRKIEDHPTLNKKMVADRMNISKNTLSQRFVRPHYGNVYDLLETSQAMGVNLFEPVIAILKNGDMPLESFYSQKDIDDLNREIKGLKLAIHKLEADKENLYNLLQKITGQNGPKS